MTNNRNITNNTMNSSNTDHHNYYNNNYYNTDPGVSQEARFLSPEDCEAIKEAYLDNISDTLPGAVAHMIEKAFSAGLTRDEIVMAIEETGFAPKPSPWYLKTILERWCEYGVTVSRIRHFSDANKAVPWWK